MSANLSAVPKLQFFDNNGNPLVGGKLYTYAAGTTTPLATYTDASAGTPNTNPIILDSRGEANVWLLATTYKFLLTDSTDATIWTVDNISNSLSLSQILAASGSAASPPYTFASDTDTGMYLAAVGQLGLSVAGTPVLRSTDSLMVLDVDLNITGAARRITGDFSNATTADRVMFQTSTVNGNTIVGLLPNGTGTIGAFRAFGGNDTTNNAHLTIASRVSDGYTQIDSGVIGSGSYLPMTFYTGGSERMRIDTSGNVGIGTTSPNQKLTVAGAGTAARLEVINTSDSDRGGYLRDTGSAFELGTNSGVRPLAFAYDGSEKMRIDISGNVGIGTSSPNDKLTVAVASGTVYVATNNNTVNMVSGVSAGNVGLVGTTTNHDLILYANNAERGRFTGTGNFQFNSGYGSVATAYGCRAWINFDGTSGSIGTGRGSGNVSSVTDNGTGSYTVNFTNSMPDANYATFMSASGGGSPYNNATSGIFSNGAGGSVGTYSASAVQVWFALLSDGGSGTDREIVNVAVFR